MFICLLVWKIFCTFSKKDAILAIYLSDFSFIFLQAVDKANGYVYGTGEERSIQQLLSCAVGARWESDRTGVAREKWMGGELEEEEEGEYLRAGGAMGDDNLSEQDEEELLEMIARQNQK